MNRKIGKWAGRVAPLGIVLLMGAAFAPAWTQGSTDAQGGPAARRIEVPEPGGSATFTGTVRGREVGDYRFLAKAGQTLSIQLLGKSPSLAFNLLDGHTAVVLPGEPSPREVTSWTGTLPADGDYVIRVYLTRAAAQRGDTEGYKLSLDTARPGTKPGTAPATKPGAKPRPGTAATVIHVAGGAGKYFVSDRSGFVPVRKVRVVLNPDRTARVETDLGGDGFRVSGTWQAQGNDAILTLMRGFDDSALKGTGKVRLAGKGKWKTVNFTFDYPAQNTRHTLTFTANNGPVPPDVD